MKKSVFLASLIVFVGLPMTVFADPTSILLVYGCPNTTGVGPNTLSNFNGARIAGYGTLTVAGTSSRAPYFTGAISANSHIPGSLSSGNYSSSTTNYDSVNAIVSCSYTSPSFDPFTVVYQLTNGGGGTIESQTPNSITINQFVGVRSQFLR
jgi:hypothetical protein